MKRCNFAVNDKVLKRNSYRKGDRLTADWLGPYEIKEITPKGVCVLSNKDGIELKTDINACHLRPYVQRVVNPPCTDVSDKDGIELKTKTNSCHLRHYVQRVVNPPCTDVSDSSSRVLVVVDISHGSYIILFQTTNAHSIHLKNRPLV